MPPTLKADMTLGTQYFALVSETKEGTAVTGGAKVVDTVEVSKYLKTRRDSSISSIRWPTYRTTTENRRCVPGWRVNDARRRQHRRRPDPYEGWRNAQCLLGYPSQGERLGNAQSDGEGRSPGWSVYAPDFLDRSCTKCATRLTHFVLTDAIYATMSRTTTDRIASTET